MFLASHEPSTRITILAPEYNPLLNGHARWVAVLSERRPRRDRPDASRGPKAARPPAAERAPHPFAEEVE